MKERPFLFSGPMVRALLAGSKTQTRRVIKDQSIGERFSHMTEDGRAHLEWLGTPCCGTGVWDVPEYSAQVACPYGQPGDRLWVRETFGHFERNENFAPGCDVFYRADGESLALEPWRPSIHMPRWASRITLDVTGVRVERLQDISIEDAKAEGAWGPDESIVDKVIAHFGIDMFSANPRKAFQMLWEQINGPESWAANPWVWVVEFKPVATTR